MPGDECERDIEFDWCVTHDAPIVTVGAGEHCLVTLGVGRDEIEESPMGRMYVTASSIRTERDERHDYGDCDHDDCWSDDAVAEHAEEQRREVINLARDLVDAIELHQSKHVVDDAINNLRALWQ